MTANIGCSEPSLPLSPIREFEKVIQIPVAAFAGFTFGKAPQRSKNLYGRSEGRPAECIASEPDLVGHTDSAGSSEPQAVARPCHNGSPLEAARIAAAEGLDKHPEGHTTIPLTEHESPNDDFHRPTAPTARQSSAAPEPTRFQSVLPAFAANFHQAGFRRRRRPARPYASPVRQSQRAIVPTEHNKAHEEDLIQLKIVSSIHPKTAMQSNLPTAIQSSVEAPETVQPQAMNAPKNDEDGTGEVQEVVANADTDVDEASSKAPVPVYDDRSCMQADAEAAQPSLSRPAPPSDESSPRIPHQPPNVHGSSGNTQVTETAGPAAEATAEPIHQTAQISMPDQTTLTLTREDCMRMIQCAMEHLQQQNLDAAQVRLLEKEKEITLLQQEATQQNLMTKEVADDNATLQAKLQATEAQVEASKVKLKSLMDSFGSLGREVQTLQDERYTLRQEVDKLNCASEKNAELQKYFQECVEKSASLKERVAAACKVAKSEVANLQQAREDLQKELGSKQRAIAEAMSTITTLNEQLMQSREAHEATTALLVEHVSSHSQKCTADQGFSMAIQRFAAIEGQITSLNGSIESLTKRQIATPADINKLQAIIVKSCGRLTSQLRTLMNHIKPDTEFPEGTNTSSLKQLLADIQVLLHLRIAHSEAEVERPNTSLDMESCASEAAIMGSRSQVHHAHEQDEALDLTVVAQEVSLAALIPAISHHQGQSIRLCEAARPIAQIDEEVRSHRDDHTGRSGPAPKQLCEITHSSRHSSANNGDLAPEQARATFVEQLSEKGGNSTELTAPSEEPTMFKPQQCRDKELEGETIDDMPINGNSLSFQVKSAISDQAWISHPEPVRESPRTDSKTSEGDTTGIVDLLEGNMVNEQSDDTAILLHATEPSQQQQRPGECHAQHEAITLTPQKRLEHPKPGHSILQSRCLDLLRSVEQNDLEAIQSEQDLPIVPYSPQPDPTKDLSDTSRDLGRLPKRHANGTDCTPFDADVPVASSQIVSSMPESENHFSDLLGQTEEKQADILEKPARSRRGEAVITVCRDEESLPRAITSRSSSLSTNPQSSDPEASKENIPVHTLPKKCSPRNGHRILRELTVNASTPNRNSSPSPRDDIDTETSSVIGPSQLVASPSYRLTKAPIPHKPQHAGLNPTPLSRSQPNIASKMIHAPVRESGEDLHTRRQGRRCARDRPDVINEVSQDSYTAIMNGLQPPLADQGSEEDTGSFEHAIISQETAVHAKQQQAQITTEVSNSQSELQTSLKRRLPAEFAESEDSTPSYPPFKRKVPVSGTVSLVESVSEAVHSPPAPVSCRVDTVPFQEKSSIRPVSKASAKPSKPSSQKRSRAASRANLGSSHSIAGMTPVNQESTSKKRKRISHNTRYNLRFNQD